MMEVVLDRVPDNTIHECLPVSAVDARCRIATYLDKLANNINPTEIKALYEMRRTLVYFLSRYQIFHY